jgi:hypothetical protein
MYFLRLLPAIMILIGGAMLFTLHLQRVVAAEERPARLLPSVMIMVGGLMLLAIHLAGH